MRGLSKLVGFTYALSKLRVSERACARTTDIYGNISTGIIAWNDPLTPGKYDIVIDVNGNGKYDENIDALDDEDIMVTPGFFVIPEIQLGTITAVVSMIVARAQTPVIALQRHRGHDTHILRP